MGRGGGYLALLFMLLRRGCATEGGNDGKSGHTERICVMNGGGRLAADRLLT